VPIRGPSLLATPLWSSDPARIALTDDLRVRLSLISTIVRYKKGEIINREDSRADAVFSIISGAAKSCKTLPNNEQHVAGFLFPHDIFEFAEHGRYMHSTFAITDVVLYRLPVTLLEATMRQDPGLEFQFIVKVCHHLRDVQRHAYFLSKRSAIAQAAFFIQIMADRQTARGDESDEIYLPMTRSDIAAYVGLSAEAASRAFRDLMRRGAVAFPDRHHATISNRTMLDQIAADRRLAEVVVREEPLSGGF
jgi:CRP/FNR family transcriptional regulator